MDNNIIIDDTVVKQATNKIIDESFEILNGELALDNKRIYQAAIKCKKQLTEINNELQIAANQLKMQEKNTIKSDDYLLKNYFQIKKNISNEIVINRIATLPRKYYEAIFRFQEELNDILGQTVQMVYVFINEASDSSPILFQMNNEDILRYTATSGGELTGKYKPFASFSSGVGLELTTAVNSMTKAALTKMKVEETPVLDETYKEVLWRFNYSREKYKDSLPTNSGLILWKPSTRWYHMLVNNKGDLAESYAALKLDLNKFIVKKNIEENIHQFMEEVEYVDNTSGFLQGDISIKDNLTGKTIEYGIKKAEASTMKLNEVLNFMNLIIEKKGMFSKEQLEATKKKLAESGERRNFIQKSFSNDLKKNVAQYITKSQIGKIQKDISAGLHKSKA